MSRFLAFVVEETLAGNSERIKEYVIALEVFERDQNYDPHADSTVRTEASKLRTRLDRYYRTIGQADSVVISIPKGRYTPAFDHGSRQNLPFLAAASEPRNPMAAAPTASCRSTSTPPDLDEPCFNAFVRRPKRFRKFSFLRSIYFCVISAALITWLIGSVGGSVFRTASQPSDFHSSMPLTNYIGSEVCPSFAPDGERVAFAWNGDNQDNFDVYVKQIGVTVLLRLTYDPEPDISPAWSPDGRSIAFLHVVAADKAEVRLIPAIAPGLARKLATVTILPGSYFGFRSIAWSPDGKWLAISDGPKFAGVMSLFVLSMETGERQRVTFPPLDYDDLDPAFSPDMHRLAFVRYSSLGASASDLYSVDLSGALKPKGEPQRLTFDNRQTATPVWTPDGRAILFARSESSGGHSLWRMNLTGGQEITQVPLSSDTSFALALSRQGNKIVYTRKTENVTIWGLDLDRIWKNRPAVTRPWITSTWSDDNPQVSPDGHQIAFQSSRSGVSEIWVCDRDGSHPRQFIHLGAVVSGFPRWSPDGRKIVFHSRPKGSATLYTVGVDGGTPKQITSGPGNDISPSWSHDGKSIYFASRRTGETHIWKLPANGGIPTQMSERSGWCPLEAIDGQYLYYVSMPQRALWKLPLTGGRQTEVLSGLAADGCSYAPARNGIYFMRNGPHSNTQELAFLRFVRVKSQGLP